MSFSMSTMRVSPRDREIFQKCAVEGKSQRVVAGEYKLTQPRIAAIVKRVKRWSEQPLPKGLGEACRGERLAGLARVHRMRLHLFREWAEEAFRQSQTVHVVKQYFDADGKKIKEERTGKSAGGNVRFLKFAEEFDKRLLEFDGVGKDGSVDLKAKNRLPDVSNLTADQKMEELEDFVKRANVLLDKWRGEKAAEVRGGEGERGRGGDKVTESASVEALARRGSADGAVIAPEPVIAAERVIGEKAPISLSESLSVENTTNSAVELSLAAVIAQLIAVINAVKSVINAAASGSVGWTSGPTVMEGQTPAKTVGPEVQPTSNSQAVGPEVQPTRNAETVGPEVQPTKTRDDFFYLFRHRLPRMHVDTDNPKRKPQMKVSPGIQYPLPEHETYFDR